VALFGFLLLREFLRDASRNKVPDAWSSKTHNRLPHEAVEKVFGRILIIFMRYNFMRVNQTLKIPSRWLLASLPRFVKCLV
jgi:hypothetical protein